MGRWGFTFLFSFFMCLEISPTKVLKPCWFYLLGYTSMKPLTCFSDFPPGSFPPPHSLGHHSMGPCWFSASYACFHITEHAFPGCGVSPLKSYPSSHAQLKFHVLWEACLESISQKFISFPYAHDVVSIHKTVITQRSCITLNYGKRQHPCLIFEHP